MDLVGGFRYDLSILNEWCLFSIPGWVQTLAPKDIPKTKKRAEVKWWTRLLFLRRRHIHPLHGPCKVLPFYRSLMLKCLVPTDPQKRQLVWSYFILSKDSPKNYPRKSTSESPWPALGFDAQGQSRFVVLPSHPPWPETDGVLKIEEIPSCRHFWSFR